MWAVIRTDASVAIGSGHVMRCCALAAALVKRGVDVVFFSRHLPENLADYIREQSLECHIFPQAVGPKLPGKTGNSPSDTADDPYAAWLGTTVEVDAIQFLEQLDVLQKKRSSPPCAIVVDHYALDERWESVVSKRTQARLVAIDDLSNRAHYCDLLIDATFGKNARDYEKLVPEHCNLKIGAKYALLRDGFARSRRESLQMRDEAFVAEAPVDNLLISMGGADKDDATLKVLKAIDQLRSHHTFTIHILVGGMYPYRDTLDKHIRSCPYPVVLHNNVTDIPSLLMQMDVCIGAAGTSSWERCCLGIPTITFVLADNQRVIAKALNKSGATIDAGCVHALEPADFAKNTLQPLIDSTEARRALSHNARSICAGQGAAFVALAVLLPERVSDEVMALRNATMDDAQLIYDWQCHPNTRRFAVNSQVPSFANHLTWLERKVADISCSIFIVTLNEVPVGIVRLDPCENLKEDKRDS